jgi:hypothetical protein
MRSTVVLATVLLVTSCSGSYSSNRGVEIPGPGTIEQKAILAEQVIASISLQSLRQELASVLPEAEPDLFNGVSLRSVVLAAKQVGAEPTTKVFIQCTFTHPFGLADAELVVERCKEIMQEALERHFQAGAAA